MNPRSQRTPALALSGGTTTGIEQYTEFLSTPAAAVVGDLNNSMALDGGAGPPAASPAPWPPSPTGASSRPRRERGDDDGVARGDRFGYCARLVDDEAAIVSGAGVSAPSGAAGLR